MPLEPKNRHASFDPDRQPIEEMRQLCTRGPRGSWGTSFTATEAMRRGRLKFTCFCLDTVQVIVRFAVSRNDSYLPLPIMIITRQYCREREACHD